MSLALLQNYSAIRNTGLSIPFGATGGTTPYVYSLAPDGAGGTIDADTGIYTSPIGAAGVDTIFVTDADNSVASGTIKVGIPLQLVCDIIEHELAIAGQVWLYNQKEFTPTDSKDYITVGVRSYKAFGGRPEYLGGSSSFVAAQSVNVQQILSVDLYSRSTLPLSDVDAVVMALSSPYAEAQMELNSFFLAPLPQSVLNLSGIDGPAIPYHLQLSATLQYFSSKQSSPSYFDTFSSPSIVPED